MTQVERCDTCRWWVEQKDSIDEDDPEGITIGTCFVHPPTRDVFKRVEYEYDDFGRVITTTEHDFSETEQRPEPMSDCFCSLWTPKGLPS